MKKKLFCITVCLFLLILSFAPANGLKLKEQNLAKENQSEGEKTDECLIIMSIPYYGEYADIEFTGGDQEEINEIEELLEGKKPIFPRRTYLEVHDMSFNITYTGKMTRRATFSYIYMSWFKPHFDCVKLFNKQFTCSIKNYTGPFEIPRFRLYQIPLGFFCPARINLYGIFYNGTIDPHPNF